VNCSELELNGQIYDDFDHSFGFLKIKLLQIIQTAHINLALRSSAKQSFPSEFSKPNGCVALSFTADVPHFSHSSLYII
jgi:hypothetical protein